MFSPAQYAWFEPVLVAALLVFIVDFIGSVSRWPALNALASAILFALIFGALVYYWLWEGRGIAKTTTPSPSAPVRSAQSSTP